MGCLPSEPFSSSSKPTAANMQKLQPLVRPAKYQGGKGPSFSAAYARAARRYGFETGRNAGFAKRNNVVVKVKSKHDKETDHEVPAESIQNGLEYVVPVKIGTPGVTLNLDFDTGSSDLWVWSSELANASRYKGHNVYNPAKSSTAKKASGSWNISYGDGSSASGNVYTDTVTVGDIAIPGQAVELAEKLSSSFLQDGGNDGLLGLAWPSINTVSPKPVATPVENMINKKLIDPPVFTVKLGRGDEAGFYSFGFIDDSVTSDTITYTPVDNSQGFWQVPSTSWTLNGKTKERSGNTTILDTGTTLLLVSDDVVDELYGAIEGAEFDNEQGGYKFPSSATLPDVSFAVGDKLYKVSGKDLAFSDAGDGYTFGGIQSSGNLGFDIFGDIFLKNVYVVFDQGEKRVGLAQRTD
ncbi:acid protease [Cerioporus squamosus]|nr:acid protease [Cerioporus squamosus]